MHQNKFKKIIVTTITKTIVIKIY